MQAYLILANGRILKGKSLGCQGTTVGEVVFATGMVGFEETLTDPSYYGQIITQTYPLIGNYGMNSEDKESGQIWAKGYIVREACTTPSNFRSEETLDTFLKENGIMAVFHYIPLHTAPAGIRFGRFHGEDVYTTKESERLLRLPMFYSLTLDQVTYICEKVREFYETH